MFVFFCDQSKLLKFKQKYEFNQANQNGWVGRYSRDLELAAYSTEICLLTDTSNVTLKITDSWL